MSSCHKDRKVCINTQSALRSLPREDHELSLKANEVLFGQLIVGTKKFNLRFQAKVTLNFTGHAKWLLIFPILQEKFPEAPVVLVTSEHLRTGKEYDSSLLWTEDVGKLLFKVCLRELQNFDGKHEDISVVCVRNTTFLNYASENCHCQMT